MSAQSEVARAEPTRENTLTGMRPRLRQDVVFAAREDGVYLQRPGDQFVLKGTSTYRWISVLAAQMTGEFTVEQLTEGLSDAHRSTLLNLVALLHERGYLRDERAAGDTEIAPEVEAVFGRQLEYVSHFAQPGRAKFTAFRESRFLLTGSPELVTATGLGLLRNGAAQVDVTAAAAFPALTEQARQLQQQGCAAAVREVDTDPAPYDLIISAGDDVQDLLHANETAEQELLPLLIFGRSAVAGPLVRPGSRPCLQCALLRLTSTGSPTDSARLWRAAALGGSGAAGQCPPHLARMLGTMLAFEAFRLRTGVFAPETERAVLIQDLDTAESTREPLLPHPFCRHCSAGSSTTGDATLLGEHVGVLGGYRDAALPQSPVRTGRVAFPSPHGSAAGPRLITAFDLDTVDSARERAVRVAATCYAEEIAGNTSEAPAATVPPADLAIHSGFSVDHSGPCVPARSMVDGRSCWLPAAAAYPQSAYNQAMLFEPTSAGAACDSSVDAAEAAGLLSALGFQGLCAALRGEKLAAELRLDPPSQDLDFLLQVASDLPGEPRILALPGAEPAFACLVTSGGDGWALGSGYSQAEAAVAALRDLIGMHSLSEASEPVDLGNPVLAELDVRTVPVAEQSAPQRAATCHERIVEALGDREKDAFAVHSTPADLRAAGLVSVRVLLGHRRC